MSKSGDLVADHVVPDHSVRQTRLERLVDRGSGPGNVSLASTHEIAQPQILIYALSACVQNADDRIRANLLRCPALQARPSTSRCRRCPDSVSARAISMRGAGAAPPLTR